MAAARPLSGASGARRKRPASPDPVADFAAAERLRAAGRPAAADRLYAMVLRAQPRHLKALQGRAAVLAAMGRADQAARLAGRARAVEAEDLCTVGHAALFYGKRDAALFCYRRAATLDPSLAEAAWGMAEVMRHRGRRAAAAGWYRRMLALDPGNAEARHMIAALGGTRPPPRAADAYVASYFDRFADYFDRQLLDQLDYRVPALLRAAVRAAGLAPSDGAAVLDLGCGTGLAGREFRLMARRLDGVDLSPAMIGRARERAIYDRLDVAEMVSSLRTLRRRYDLLLCADALVYVGALAPLFAGAARALRPGGLFAATTEWRPGRGYALLPTGRYAHGRPCVRRCAAAAGLVEVAARNAMLRTERGRPVTGTVWVFRRP